MNHLLEIEMPSNNGVNDFIDYANKKLNDACISINFDRVPDNILIIDAVETEQLFRAGMLIGAFLQKQLLQVEKSIENINIDSAK